TSTAARPPDAIMEQAVDFEFRQYLSSLVSSGLIPDDQLRELYSQFQREDPEGSRSTYRFSEWLIHAKRLSRWQHWHLASGRCKGFFLGRYKLVDYLGSGGMSRVYAAEHPTLKKLVAVKLLAPKQDDHTFYLRRFQMECEAISLLNHSNIVRAYDFDSDGKFYFLVMEHVDGPDLQKIVQRHGPLPYIPAAGQIQQAAAGLAYAHRKGIVHRDVKPSNLLINSEGVVKILDLGVVRLPTPEDASITLEQGVQVVGTVDYLPPEQFIDSHNVDGRADLYSLGCTLYFLLTGRPPFNEGGQSQRILMHQASTPPSIYRTRPDAPPGLVEICRRMMEKDPRRRFSTAEDVRQALRQWRQAYRAGLVWRLSDFQERKIPITTAGETDTVRLSPQDTMVLRADIRQDAPAEPVRVRCPSCDAGLKATPDLAGRIAQCPKCSGTVLVPEAENGGTRGQLQNVVQELLKAAATKHPQRVSVMINALVLPYPADWFREIFGKSQGMRAAHEYLANLPRIKAAFRRFIERMSEQGMINVEARLLSETEPDAEQEELGRIFCAMRRPIDLYSIRLRHSNEEESEIAFGAFAQVDDKFRFLGPLKAVA
ncbi:MAG: serine/threonine protein kinase, partial [Planctomycetales bacterium]